MFGKKFELNEEMMALIGEIGRAMPGGFLIYQEEAPGRILYANQALIDIFGCRDLAEFKELTGYTFEGLIHPDDYAQITKSIRSQIDANSDNLDFVEYRIIRRDGEVRWVDDYGHHIETDAYGRISYVFISDITQKKEELDSDKAIRSGVIEALSEAYHTVWLIRDVEKESFSLFRGDTIGDTVHGAPNRDALHQMKYSQAKEYYINSTVAPSDRERLQEELKIENIAGRLREKPQYSVNYLRAMPDGSERYYRIEFAKVDMPGGKMGVVCGFRDVDEDVREEQMIQKTLEERVALQAQLLEQQKQREELDKMITAMASDYRSVYHVDLDANRAICHRADPNDHEQSQPGIPFSYLERFTYYANQFVAENYREGFLKFISPEHIREKLLKERIIAYRYLAKRDGKEYYEMIRMAGVRHPKDRKDGVVHAVGLGLTIIDAEMRDSLAKNRALAEALDAAQEANMAKTAFLSSMSHEIRTPMNAIIGLNNLALQDETLSKETREYMEKIDGSARHLLGLINDILDMSRIESGRMILRREEFSLHDMLDQIGTMVMSQCSDKGLRFTSHTDPSVYDYYIGDDMKLKQILLNILSNAIKFTEAPGEVVLSVEQTAVFHDQSTLKFVVRDTGIGMDPSFIPKIFDSFTQEDSSRHNKYGSTGLGMAITKNIVEMMNGTISVESEKGVGSAFTVIVTLKNCDQEAAAAHEGQHPHEAKNRVELAGRRFLLAEDILINAEIMKHLIGVKEAEIEHAGNGRVAVEMFERSEPGYYDAVLMDVRMPEMDGLEAASAIRASDHPDAKKIPIIAMTANAFDEDMQRSLQAGMNAHLSKPVEPEVLYQTIEELLWEVENSEI